jgi:hypothetical protein
MRTLHLPALLAVSCGLSACVVPVGPEWTDPQSNYPPTLSVAEPAVGSDVVQDPDAGVPLTIKVVLSDKNTKDTLWARWLVDYPPFVAGVSSLVREDIQQASGTVERPALYFAPSCNDLPMAQGTQSHRLLLAVSDRAFDGENAAAPDQVPAGNSRFEATWQFRLECP